MTGQDPHQKLYGNHQLGPYAHPEYWDGHIIGQSIYDQYGESKIVLPGTRALVQHALETYLNTDGPRAALERYEKGDVFNSEDYAPGTIVAMRREQLSAPCSKLTLDFEGVTPAVPDTSLPPIKDMARVGLEIHGGAGYEKDGRKWGYKDILQRGIAFESRGVWGVVAHTIMRKHVLLVLNTNRVVYAPPQSDAAWHFYDPQHATLPIGRVYHLHNRKMRENLIRTTALEVCQTGRTEHSGSAWLAWLRQPISE